MKKFLEKLRALHEASNTREFVKRERAVYQALEELMESLDKNFNKRKKGVDALVEAGVEIQNSKTSLKKLAQEILNPDSEANPELIHCDWVDAIPDLLIRKEKQKVKDAKKRLVDLIRIASIRNLTRWETHQDLKRQIQHIKSYDEYLQFVKGQKIRGYRLPTLQERYSNAEQRSDENNKKINTDDFKKIRDERAEYLIKKDAADKLAKILTAVVSIVGVGLIGTITMMAVLPVLPLAAAIVVIVISSLLGGYTEAFVYHGYIQKFCRQMMLGFWGFFEGIDNTILNREAKKPPYNKRDRHALEPNEIRDILEAHNTERVVKKILTVVAFPLALAAGIGFMGLLFTEVTTLLTTIFVVSGPLLVILPWVFGVVVMPIYAILMCGMIYKAIKQDAHKKFAENMSKLFERPEGRSTPMHYFINFLKGFGLVLVLAIAAVATASTAGAWLKNSVDFFATAFGIVGLVAHKIADVASTLGYIVGAIFLITNFYFSTEKSVQSFKDIAGVTWDDFKAQLKDTFSSPKKFFSKTSNLILMLLHIGQNAAVSAAGAEGDFFKPIYGDNKVAADLTGALAETGEEFFVDFSDNVGGGHHSKNKNDDIEHANEGEATHHDEHSHSNGEEHQHAKKPHHHHHASSKYEKYGVGKLVDETPQEKDEHAGHSHGNIVSSGASIVSAIGSGVKKAVQKTGLVKSGIFAPPVKQKPIQLKAIAPRAVM